MVKARSPMRPVDRRRSDSYASSKAARPQPVQDPKHNSQDDDQRAEPPVHVLSHNEAVTLFGEQAVQISHIMPFSIVLGQVAITLLHGLGWYVGSWLAEASTTSATETGLSALLGGGVCVVPSAWFAMRLSTAERSESITRLVVDETIKVLGTVALLMIVVMVFKGLHWPPLLITLVLALKMYWVGLAL